jgi:tetratricopeptide (TPR) repeat protein
LTISIQHSTPLRHFAKGEALYVSWMVARLVLPLMLFFAGQNCRAATPQQMLAAGQVDDAIPALSDQLKASPNDAASHNLFCRAYYMIEDWDSGVPHCERATTLDPANSLYFDWLGRIYGAKAEHSSFLSAATLAKKVRLAFERSVQLDPKNWEARVDLGEFYTEAPSIVGGGKDKARQQADALMSLNPAMGNWLLARIDEKNKDRAAAEGHYRDAIAASHGGVRGWLDLGNFFFHAQRLDDMQQAFQHLEAAAQDCPESLLYAAQLLYRANRDYNLAIRLLRKYLAAPVEHGPAFKARDLLGQLLEKQGDRQGAAEQYQAALTLWRGDAHAKKSLVRLQP